MIHRLPNVNKSSSVLQACYLMLNVFNNLFILEISKSYFQSSNGYVYGFRETLHCGLQVQMLQVQGKISLLLAES